jgi:signal transduction histidine kinase
MGERRKAKKKSILWMVLIVLLTVPTIAVCAFPYLGLSEGSLPYALAKGLYGIFERYLSFFPQGELSVYGLAPLAAFALLVLVTTLLGAGVISFLLKAIAFYSLYLVFCYAQGAKGFEISTYLPSNYQWLALGAFFLTCLLLLCSWISRHKKNRKVEATKMAKIEQPKEETEPEVQVEDQTPVEPVQEQQEPLKVATSQDKPARPKSTLDLKTAHKSLTEVQVPKFDKFPNSLAASYLKPHDGVSVYDVVQREAEIKKAAEEQRKLEAERIKALEEERQRRIALEEERQRQEAEAEKKRLESLFKPRTLMKRLSEEAEVEKKFSSYQGEDAEVDYGISPYQIQQEYQSQQTNVNFKTQNAKVGFQSPQSASVQFETPKFETPQFEASQFEVPQFEAPPAQMINPYAVQYSQSQQPTVPQQEQVQLESNPQPQAQFQSQPQAQSEPKLQPQVQSEPMPQPSSAFKDEELRAQTEMERQQKLREEEQARKLAEAELARKATEEAPVQAPQHESQQEEEDEAEDDEADFEKSKAEFDRETEAEAERKEKKTGPDIDYVSGIAGLKSSAAGNSYLIDKQKFVYQFPPESFLQHYPVSAKIYEDIENDPTGMAIVNTFKDFNIETTLLHIQHGPTFTLYELSLQRGVRVSKVVNLAEDVAMNLAVANVRILAPIPGKNAIGIEVPNKKRDTIGFDVMMEALKAKPYKIPMVLGKNITGDSIVIDLTKTPHLLVAGTTGSGKSVCINGLICSVLYTKTPKEVRMLLVDPKMVELSVYNGIPHLLTPVITDPKKALKAMNFIVEEMERRMALFASVGARKIEDYNEKIVEKGLLRVKLPYIMVIIDEFADLMLAVGKELEASIKRITAVARFCGIHLVLATQRPSADVITGIIKSNIPTQIAFAVANGTNSRIIIDSNGAENLLGRGDMLYNSPEFRTPTRIQGAYIDSEIEQIVNFVKTQGQPDYIDESYFEDDEEDEEEEKDSASSASEDMFSRAWKIVSDRGEASASYLQRRLNIGYNRAANLIEQLEDAGYIGPARGAKPREILKLYGSD